MALRNAVKMVSRGFSTGAGSIKNGSKHDFIRDARLRNLCVQLEQATEEANQWREEFNAIFALKKLLPRDQLIWLGIIASINGAIAYQVTIIRRMKAQLAARLTDRTA
ncbi:hypothetical protein MKW94_006535 [Papaver nudicaule]|uniref:Uncharacterized protein n=1 Tax=Papaver nudicaule TaxID=74823 RepID=A0AA42AUA7_PAPNU|nr:hypothetical protein [Papaver nudicaule]